jgi:hypothetical protein
MPARSCNFLIGLVMELIAAVHARYKSLARSLEASLASKSSCKHLMPSQISRLEYDLPCYADAFLMRAANFAESLVAVWQTSNMAIC